MPTTPFDELSDSWDVSKRHTAADDQDILLTNTSGYVAYFEITTTDDLPGVHARKAHPVRPGRSVPMQLKSGERLWFAGESASASLLVP
ncbi:hypothetical protein [Leisingera sp. ANG-Vp]|uniref:hypothetical protein n=1 Tax=Leisingera sp. ANG-Vp TaxID=1577896 RepID=UPI00057C839A|nr:hypothetical protein [Leisingera sp. ANG-Vp]KIC15014.1 hypothetical protein RA20_19155 [Leisingera sp. ANG-Vp]